jgi:hypothetical protein
MNGKKHLFPSLKPYRQTSKHQSPIEQQHYRSCLNLITILISLFLLISITIGVYHIVRYFIDENISRKSKQRIIMITTNIPNDKKSLIESNKTKKLNINSSYSSIGHIGMRRV